MTVTILENQTIFDIMLINAGKIEAAYYFAAMYKVSLTGVVLPIGTYFGLIPDNLPMDKKIIEFFKNQNEKPATMPIVSDIIEEE